MAVNFFEMREGGCGVAGCTSPALPLSESCRMHLEDPFAWYESYVGAIPKDAAPERAEDIVNFGHTHLRYALVDHGIAAEFFRNHKARQAAGRAIAFDTMPDVTFWLCLTAAGGIVAGESYDLAKSLVRKVAGDGEASRLEDVVPKEDYEARQSEAEDEIVVETEEEIEVRVRRTHRVIVRKKR